MFEFFERLGDLFSNGDGSHYDTSGHESVIDGFDGSTLNLSQYSHDEIVEALAQSGDLGLQGKRKNILLIREDATGKKEAHRLDMTDANLINSPYFYLQQNDIVYVEPNGAIQRHLEEHCTQFTFRYVLQ